MTQNVIEIAVCRSPCGGQDLTERSGRRDSEYIIVLRSFAGRTDNFKYLHNELISSYLLVTTKSEPRVVTNSSHHLLMESRSACARMKVDEGDRMCCNIDISSPIHLVAITFSFRNVFTGFTVSYRKREPDMEC